MFSEAELIDAIDQLKAGKHSIQNCEKLAAVYIVLDHLYGERLVMDTGYSNSKDESKIGLYGESKLLKTVAGKSAENVWILIDELIDALMVLNPRLVNNFFEKLNNVR